MNIKSLFSNKQTAEIHEEPVTFYSDGLKLNGKILYPKQYSADTVVPGTVLCHGFGGSMKAVESSARILTEMGLATFIFDFRGHGQSEGILDGSFPNDAVAAYNTFKNMPGIDSDNIGFVGHSLGAMSAIMASDRIENPKALVALSCPPHFEKDMFAELPANFGQWGPRHNFVLDLPRQGAHPWLKGLTAVLCRIYMYFNGDHVRVNISRFFEGALKMRMGEVLSTLDCDKLFVFCKGDNVTPYLKTAPVYASACEPKTLFMSKGGFHTTPIMKGNVRNQWITWLANVLTNKS